MAADSDPLEPKSGKPPMGLFNYPVLQAADILVHGYIDLYLQIFISAFKALNLRISSMHMIGTKANKT